MKSIAESAGKVDALVTEVKSGSEEQARGFKQITNAITQMERVTQSTAARAEESSAASADLSTPAQAIERVALHFRVMITGAKDAALHQQN